MVEDHPDRAFTKLGEYLLGRGIGHILSRNAPSDKPGTVQFGGSALFAYKLNWQSVMFVGYGDDRELSDQRRLEHLDRQFFVKLSYAFQR